MKVEFDAAGKLYPTVVLNFIDFFLQNQPLILPKYLCTLLQNKMGPREEGAPDPWAMISHIA